MTFSSPVREARVEAANVVSKIALIEIPRNMWPGLIQALIENMKSPNAFLRQSTVITLGELCEGMVCHSSNLLHQSVFSLSLFLFFLFFLFSYFLSLVFLFFIPLPLSPSNIFLNFPKIL